MNFGCRQILLVLFLATNSCSQEERKPKYVVVDKHIDIREIIRFGPRRSPSQISEMKIPGTSNNSANAINLKKFHEMLPWSGLKWLGDSGQATSCGPKGSDIVLKWTPKVITEGAAVKIDFSMKPTIDFDTGTVSVKVTNPPLQFTQDISCALIKTMYKDLNCPIKKDAQINGSFQYKVPNGIPKEPLTVEVEIKSSAPPPNNLFACLNITVTLQ